MPKRTNDFQKLVYLVRVNLAAGAIVTESKMLLDRLTKRKREVDVCVEGLVGGHPVMVCIECRDHKRPADVTWVETMKAKHGRLPTNALILASRNGFTNEARKVASMYGIQALSLQEVDNADFPTLLKATSSLWTKSVTVTIQKVLVNVLATPNLIVENVVVMPDNLVYVSDGIEVGPIRDLVDALMKSAYARDYLLSEAKQEHVWFELRWEPPRDDMGNPLFLKKLEPETFREIGFIQITGPCEFKISEFGLRRGMLGDVQMAWGKAEIQGQKTIVVATRDTVGIEKISLTFAGKPPQVEAPHSNNGLQGTPASGRS
jgi:hypothetical protein